MSPIVEYNYKSRHGFTLLELLVSMAIFVAVIGSVLTIFTSVTNTVRRSYRTMDVYENAQAVFAVIERDVRRSFSYSNNPDGFKFYGEPYGFSMVGISSDNELGRLSYVVHPDTSRMDPTSERGEQITLFRPWSYLAQPNPAAPGYYDLGAYYNLTGDYIELEVEIIYGLLLRVYEDGISNLNNFPWINRVLEDERLKEPVLASHMPQSRIETLLNDASSASSQEFPLLSRYLWALIDSMDQLTVGIPAATQRLIEQSEKNHYWIQLLQGPGIPSVPWDLCNLWWSENVDRFWYDHKKPSGLKFPNEEKDENRRFLWDYVVARDFVMMSFLLDPATGQRIITEDGQFVPVAGPNPYLFNSAADYRYFDPILKYAVEERGKRKTTFNTLYDLDFPMAQAQGAGAYQVLSSLIIGNEVQSNPQAMNHALSVMMEDRQFYDLGSPLQPRSPVSLDLCFWVVDESSAQGGPLDIHRFSQTIFLHTGYKRSSRSVR